jgi:large subunit ribosomal protein L15
VGRGRASGAGKTCNRGHNGEGQRSGNSHKRGFEGGQMPAHRRIPKFRSFPQPNKRHWLELNVKDLEKLIPSGEDKLTYDLLIEKRLLKRQHDGVRILGNGEINAKVTVQAHYVTNSAKEKIEAAGGKVELIEAPVKTEA